MKSLLGVSSFLFKKVSCLTWIEKHILIFIILIIVLIYYYFWQFDSFISVIIVGFSCFTSRVPSILSMSVKLQFMGEFQCQEFWFKKMEPCRTSAYRCDLNKTMTHSAMISIQWNFWFYYYYYLLFEYIIFMPSQPFGQHLLLYFLIQYNLL